MLHLSRRFAVAALSLALCVLPAAAFDLVFQPGLMDKGGLALTNGLTHSSKIAHREETAIVAYSLDSAATASRDLWLLACTEARFSGLARQDLRVLAQGIKLDGTVKGNVLAQANGIQFSSNAVVKGDAALSARTIFANGSFGAKTYLFGDTVRLAGTYAGDVRVFANEISVAPGTVIAGTLAWNGPKAPSIPADASIGAVVAKEQEAPARSAVDVLLDRARMAFGFFIAFLLLGIPFIRFFPVRAATTLTQMQSSPFKSILLGLLLLLVLPFAALFLLAAGPGFPAGIALLLLIILGLLHTPVLLALFLGHLMLRRTRATVLKTLLLGLLVLAFLLAVAPGLCVSILLFGGVYGFGAFALSVFRAPRLQRIRKPDAATPPPMPPSDDRRPD